MHELGVAIDIVDVALEAAAAHDRRRVVAVRLRLGLLAGVVADALLFSFDVATAGTPLEGARLHIEPAPVVAWCALCKTERELVDPAIRRCPVCHALTPRLVGGDELQVVGLEISDE